MKLIFRTYSATIYAVLIMMSTPVSAGAMNAEQAEAQVKSAICSEGQSVDAVLSQKVNSVNRDLGWQVFQEEERYIVERAVLVSKSMQLRYRWELDAQGAVHANNDRAKTLCETAS